MKNDNADNGKKKQEEAKEDEELKKDYQLLRAVDTVKALIIYSKNKE